MVISVLAKIDGVQQNLRDPCQSAWNARVGTGVMDAVQHFRDDVQVRAPLGEVGFVAAFEQAGVSMVKIRVRGKRRGLEARIVQTVPSG